MKNKYVRRSKISEAKFRKIIMYFALELDAQKIAALTSLNRNTINRYLNRVRSRIVDLCDDQALEHQYEAGRMRDPSPNGKGTRPLAAEGDSLPVFGIQSRNAHIYTEILPLAVHQRLRQTLRKERLSKPLRIPQLWRYYDGIVDLNGRWHYRFSPVYAGTDAGSANRGSIEEFLGFARKRLTTIMPNGNDHFILYLKECEFRFNNRRADLYQLLLKRFRKNPLS